MGSDRRDACISGLVASHRRCSGRPPGPETVENTASTSSSNKTGVEGAEPCEPRAQANTSRTNERHPRPFHLSEPYQTTPQLRGGGIPSVDSPLTVAVLSQHGLMAAPESTFGYRDPHTDVKTSSSAAASTHGNPSCGPHPAPRGLRGIRRIRRLCSRLWWSAGPRAFGCVCKYESTIHDREWFVKVRSYKHALVAFKRAATNPRLASWATLAVVPSASAALIRL